MAARPLMISAEGVKGPSATLSSALLMSGASEAAVNSTKVAVIRVGSCAHCVSNPLPARKAGGAADQPRGCLQLKGAGDPFQRWFQSSRRLQILQGALD